MELTRGHGALKQRGDTFELLDDMVTLETAAIGLENQALRLRAEMIEEGWRL